MQPDRSKKVPPEEKKNVPPTLDEGLPLSPPHRVALNAPVRPYGDGDSGAACWSSFANSSPVSTRQPGSTGPPSSIPPSATTSNRSDER